MRSTTRQLVERDGKRQSSTFGRIPNKDVISTVRIAVPAENSGRHSDEVQATGLTTKLGDAVGRIGRRLSGGKNSSLIV